ncbi:MAG: hypothetical protein KAI43_09945 [Candidatus Aureabacteria bacterium]|nr:hypothetical protein [Candidatus Auribacterota bacterium]
MTEEQLIEANRKIHKTSDFIIHGILYYKDFEIVISSTECEIGDILITGYAFKPINNIFTLVHDLDSTDEFIKKLSKGYWNIDGLIQDVIKEYGIKEGYR